MNIFATPKAAVIEAASRLGIVPHPEPHDWWLHLSVAQVEAVETWSTMLDANPGVFRRDH